MIYSKKSGKCDIGRINDKGDIFKEVREMRKTAPIVSSMIDGVTINIETHFANVYEKLYNSIDDKEMLMSTRSYTTQLMIKRS